MGYELNSSMVISDTIDGEVLAIRSDNGAYYSMRGPAATAWTVLISGSDVDDAALAASQHHGADQSVVRADLATFTDLLLAERLIIDNAGISSEAQIPNESKGQPWDTPRFEKYTDMQDLLLFDPIHEVQAAGWPAVATDQPK